MRIPEIRVRMHQLAEEYMLPELHYLADQLKRRKPCRPRARTLSAPMTPELRQQIVTLAEAEPTLPYNRIGDAVNVNQGRVSEVLAGFRK